MTFSVYIKKARLAADMSQGYLAKALDFSTNQFVSNWERGLAYPSIESVPKLAKALAVKPHDLASALVDCMCEKYRKKLEQKVNSVI